jgi:hypothetical protein
MVQQSPFLEEATDQLLQRSTKSDLADQSHDEDNNKH